MIDGRPAFVPAPLRPELFLGDLFDQYGTAMAALGRLNAKLAQLGNPNLIIRPLQRREALTSSAMEGTYTTSDALAYLEAGAVETATPDTREVLNYVTALNHAVTAMDHLPICHRLIRETHEKLLGGLPAGRGGQKRPGEYKREQNWIGGLTAQTARFVPAPPLETVAAMDQLEAFIDREKPSTPPPLLEAALVHYQFETIHPFADGNGRVGRILIPLLLLSKGLITSPVFYPSASLETRKDEYIDRLFALSTRGEWTNWISFFCEICTDTCHGSIAIIDRLLELQMQYRQDAMAKFRSNNNLQVIDQLFVNPVLTTRIVKDLLGVTRRAARMTIANLEEIGAVEHLTGTNMPEYFISRAILRAGE